MFLLLQFPQLAKAQRIRYDTHRHAFLTRAMFSLGLRKCIKRKHNLNKRRKQVRWVYINTRRRRQEEMF